MIYTILRISWWGCCLSLALFLVYCEWNSNDAEFSFGEKAMLSLFTLFGIVLFAAVVQAFLTWLSNF